MILELHCLKAISGILLTGLITTALIRLYYSFRLQNEVYFRLLLIRISCPLYLELFLLIFQICLTLVTCSIYDDLDLLL